jgi:hypothetical protein
LENAIVNLQWLCRRHQESVKTLSSVQVFGQVDTDVVDELVDY